MIQAKVHMNPRQRMIPKSHQRPTNVAGLFAFQKGPQGTWFISHSTGTTRVMILNRVRSFLFASLFVIPCFLHATFSEDGWGARPVGMGKAFTAVADDSNASLYNPAGLTQLGRHELSAMYSRLFLGERFYLGDNGDTTNFSQSYLAYASKYTPEVGSFGLSWANSSTANLYREDAVVLSYSRKLDDLVSINSGLSLGASLKYLRVAFTTDAQTKDDPVFIGGSSADAVSFDVGLLYVPQDYLKGFRVGLSGLNLNQPNIGLLDREPVPAVYRLGLAYQVPSTIGLLPAVDVTLRKGEIGVNGGVEAWFFQNMLGLRTGVNKNEGAAGMSFYQQVNEKWAYRFDYGFTIPFRIEGTSGSHRFSGTLMF